MELKFKHHYILKNHRRKEKNVDASSFYGIWKDEDFLMSSERLVDEIRSSRKFRDDIERFQKDEMS